ncbi:hypothetical protein AVEN_118114-1 [Araneus ventricosus]|uniref:Uncharacterized protein n=1 Tax=Araneus ventricosus TaxID=182803 RepID=A0A4Y2Q997_ARAVE|nr:hypothetical protein AVEN_118114-1 [Araneus ventricosus]
MLSPHMANCRCQMCGKSIGHSPHRSAFRQMTASLKPYSLLQIRSEIFFANPLKRQESFLPRSRSLWHRERIRRQFLNGRYCGFTLQSEIQEMYIIRFFIDHNRA